MRERLQSAWLRRGPLACALWPLAVLFAAVAGLRRLLYRAGVLRTESAGVPVLVVGNVVAGGAGKTPVVIALVEHLQRRGLRVGVVSRGYGRHGADCRAVLPDSDARGVGDEPLLIARRTGAPVYVAPRRIDAARALRRAHPGVQLLVCDDGLQHLQLARNLELCVFDDRGVGNGWPLPAGPLREAWPRPVDLVLRSEGAAGIEGFMLRRALAPLALQADGQTVELARLQTQRCVALAGIAQPQRFFDMLRAAGVSLEAAHALPDHHDFSSGLPPLPSGARLLCTEKDAVKLWPQRPDALAVPLRLEIEPAFWAALDARLAPQLSSPDGPQTA